MNDANLIERIQDIVLNINPLNAADATVLPVPEMAVRAGIHVDSANTNIVPISLRMNTLRCLPLQEKESIQTKKILRNWGSSLSLILTEVSLSTPSCSFILRLNSQKRRYTPISMTEFSEMQVS